MRRAQVRLLRAVKSGAILKLDSCQKCGCGPTEAHHHNGYGDHWWDVVWLCRSCHTLAEVDLADATTVANPDANAPASIEFVGGAR